MSIPLKRYVDITSGVGAGASVEQRDLIGRMISINPLIPTGGVEEFSSADAVGEYFGFDSQEYLRAVFYFGWISKNITRAQMISFARWADAATAPLIYGAKGAQSVGDYTGITVGAFILTLGATTLTVSPMDFSAAVSLSDVAAVVQAAIRAEGTGAIWDNATVVWNSTRQSFDFVAGATGAAAIAIEAGPSNDVAELLGWLSPTTILSDGSAVQGIAAMLAAMISENDNFGSFAFMPTLTEDQIVEAAEWNVTQNNEFMYSVRCSVANSDNLAAALEDIGGVTLTLAPLAAEYPEMVPMMILAATDYTTPNSTQNYEFQMFNLTASVTTDADADVYDGLRVNYYGQTQTAGRRIEFYQQGVMQGLPVDPRDQNTYANEIWLKDAAATSLMTLLLALPKIPANAKGRAQILAILQGVINLAVSNGTISPGKPLTKQNQTYITEITADPLAWYQVQNIGYWVDAVIQSFTQDDVVRYKAVYTLVYSKDDVIRKIEGRDILI